MQRAIKHTQQTSPPFSPYLKHWKEIKNKHTHTSSQFPKRRSSRRRRRIKQNADNKIINSIQSVATDNCRPGQASNYSGSKSLHSVSSSFFFFSFFLVTIKTTASKFNLPAAAAQSVQQKWLIYFSVCFIALSSFCFVCCTFFFHHCRTIG